MHNFICRYKHYLIAVLVILISTSIIFVIAIQNKKKKMYEKTTNNSISYQENKTNIVAFPNGFIYTITNNDKLEKNILSKEQLITSFEQAVKIASILDGSSYINIDSTDVKYFTDKEKKVPFYRVKNKLFSTRNELYNLTSSFFSKDYTSELCNKFYSNDLTTDTLYIFTDFNDKLYVLNSHLINNFEFDYVGYEKANKSYTFITQDENNITFKVSISFNASNPSTNKINKYHTSYKYTYTKNNDNIWLLSDFYSPVSVCNDVIYNNIIE